MAPRSLSSCSSASSRNGEGEATTAVAIDKDKNSQAAVRWAVDNQSKKNANVFLVHVRTQSLQSRDDAPKEGRAPTENEMQQFFLPYRGFCARKGVRVKEVVLHDIDISSALVDFIHNNSITTMVLGASSRNPLTRALFRSADVPTSLCRTAPDFCSVYVIYKGKVQNVRSASQTSTPRSIASSKQSSQKGFSADTPKSDSFLSSRQGSWRSAGSERISFDRSSDLVQLTPRGRLYNNIMSSPKHSSNSMLSSPQHPASNLTVRVDTKGSTSCLESTMNIREFSEPPSFESIPLSCRNFDQSDILDVPRSSDSPQSSRDLEAEMRRLKLELKQTMNMYNSACKEAITSKEKVKEIDQWKTEEARKIQAAKQSREAALALAEMEKQKAKAAIEAAQMAQQIAELEVQKRKNAEMKAIREEEGRKKAVDALARSDIRYRKYTIEEIEIATDYFSSSVKVGEGGYGPVYRAFLDHTAVAIKVLKPEMSQGKKQFQQEVQILSYIRHPHMVLLLGACPEYGCLVYEYMANGSLEDRIFRRNNTHPLSWRTRFRIAAEIATALLFLHQTKPEPLVHRDLKPANILLDRNYVSKISDVGLARLVPPAIADCVTQYQMTAAAGTFCYIDPEYQQTGMLSIKSDIYSFGIMLLQIITAKPPMGLSHHVGRAIESGTFLEILDPTVRDWPFEEALSFAKLALQCCELRRKDRPDLCSIVLPELQRLSHLGSDSGAIDRGGITYGASITDPCFQISSPLNWEARRSGYGRQTIIQETPASNEDGSRSSTAKTESEGFDNLASF